MLLLLIYVAIALGVSFLCSVLEAVLLSVTPSYIAAEEERGHRNGKLWRVYKTDIDRPLAAILSLNTIAHTVGAAGAGAQATALFGEAYFGLISAVLTLLILFVSEIIPKTLGALFWRQLSPPCAIILRFIMWAMSPLVAMAQVLTRLMSRGAGAHSYQSRRVCHLSRSCRQRRYLGQGRILSGRQFNSFSIAASTRCNDAAISHF